MVSELGLRIIGEISVVVNSPSLGEIFYGRLAEGNLSREENEEDHVCVFGAIYNLNVKKVFMGKHKKSGLWLFNGGHMDKGELPRETLIREIKEELGWDIFRRKINKPGLLTVTPIDNPTKQKCKTHYDIWYFLECEEAVVFDQDKLSEEFEETRWLTTEQARQLTTFENTICALDYLDDLMNSK